MGVFDADYVEELTGRVSRIAQVSSPAWGTSLYLVLDTEAGPLEVRVGPAWYVEQQEFTLSPGDTIRVAGSRVSANGGTALIAAELYKGDQMLVLRDDDGRPLWPASRK